MWIKFSAASLHKRYFRVHLDHLSTLRLINNSVASQLIITACATLESRTATVNFAGLVQRHDLLVSKRLKSLVDSTSVWTPVKRLIVARNNVLAIRRHIENLKTSVG